MGVVVLIGWVGLRAGTACVVRGDDRWIEWGG